MLGFDPWQHPTMGTNLREPVPADPRLIPQFTPISKATPAERAAVSAALVKEAGMSARQIGVPLSFHDFPDHPSMSGGGKKEDPMHASNPLFGLNAPRWRAMQGLEEHGIPGTAAWDGVVALPVEKKAQQLYQRHAKQLKRPMWKLIEQGADPLGIGAASSSSSPGAGTGHSDVPDVAPVGTSPFNMTTPAARPPPSSTPSSSTPPMRRALFRTYAISDIESTSNNVPRTSSLRRTSTMATIGSTTSEVSSLSRVSTTATIGSEPDLSSLLTTTTKSKSKAKKKQLSGKQRDTRTKTAARPSPSPPSSSSTAPEQPKHAATLKRGRGTAELDDATTTAGGSDTDADGDINISQPWAETNQEKEDEEGAEPARKRRKPSPPKRNTSSPPTRSDGDGQETGQGQQPRRSTRVTRASAAAAVPKPAARGRATKGKKANKRS